MLSRGIYVLKPNLPNFAPFQNGNIPITNPIIKTGVTNASGSLFWPDLASSGPLLRSARRQGPSVLPLQSGCPAAGFALARLTSCVLCMCPSVFPVTRASMDFVRPLCLIEAAIFISRWRRLRRRRLRRRQGSAHISVTSDIRLIFKLTFHHIAPIYDNISLLLRKRY